MPAAIKVGSRYEIKEPLGEGGMGVVYRAYDTSFKRDVAIKTIRDFQNRAALELFWKECDIQKSLNHPNIVDIYDKGEFEEGGQKKPYFVMPLLRGVTLDKLTRNSSYRLTVERSIGIISQICKGLQAAHDSGLVHRDLKPSNIFVLEDDSVKIIDFGVAHLVDQRSSLGLKGTLLYMSPEQIQMKRTSALSDIFSLGVVCYEILTRRHPFERPTSDEVVHAILHETPPPASDLNPAVNAALSQVVHAAMAKQPLHRFSSCRELADALQKALRYEPIERFDPARIQPRIERAQKALGEGEYEFAAEILTALQAEGYLHSDIIPLQRQIDQALRERTVGKLLDSARRREKEQEYQLALQKVQEILDIDPGNAEALALSTRIEAQRSGQQIDSWLRLADQHIENHAYNHARQALQNVLQLKPRESRALRRLAEVDDEEQEYVKKRQEKERLYQDALEARRKGELSSALTMLERIMKLDGDAPDTTSPERGTAYQDLYKDVRSELDALNNSLDEARKHLKANAFKEALAICDEYLAKYPGHALFRSLKLDVEEAQRQELSAFVARIDREVAMEPDLNRRVSILKDALEHHPNEHFEGALQRTVAKRDLVDSIVAKARNLEERGQFAEALGQWEILRTIYSQYPGLDFELERLAKRRDQQARSEAKARWTDQIDRSLGLGDFTKAKGLAQNALAEFPDDPELLTLEKQANQAMGRSAEAQRLLEEGQRLCAEHRIEEGLDVLRRAYALDERNSLIRSVLVESVLSQARAVHENDWNSADTLVQEAMDLDPGNPHAKSLNLMILDHKRSELVDQCLSQAREAQAGGDLEGAMAHVERGLSSAPQEPRLIQRLAILKKALDSQRSEARRRDIEELRNLERTARTVVDQSGLQSLSPARCARCR